MSEADEKKSKGQKKKEKERQSSHESKKEDEEAPELSFAQMEGKCYCCGKPGHKSPSCHHKSQPKSERAINKTPETFQVQDAMALMTENEQEEMSSASS